MAAFRMLVRGELPAYSYLPIVEYAVQSSDGKTVDCDLTDTTLPLPAHLAKVPLRWLSGEDVTPSSGQRCFIAFPGGDPARAVCVGGDPTPSSRAIAASSTLTLKGGGMPATEHVATVEGVATMLVNFVYLLFAAGNPSTWAGAGKLLDSTDPSMTQLATAFTTLFTNCNSPVLPTVAAGGGIMLPTMLASLEAQLAAKIPDVLPGVTPFGFGAPSVKSG